MIVLRFATEIKGQATVDGHTGWINVDSMQFGVGRHVSLQTGGSAKREVSSPAISELTFSRQTDMASPELFYQACGGVSLGKCEIHVLQVVDNKPQVFMKIELEEAIVSNFSLATGGDMPTDSFCINFAKISFEIDTFDGKKVTAGTPKKWDLSANKTY